MDWHRFLAMAAGAFVGQWIFELCFRRSVDPDRLGQWQEHQESFNRAIAGDFKKTEDHVNRLVGHVNGSLREMRTLIDEQLGDED